MFRFASILLLFLLLAACSGSEQPSTPSPARSAVSPAVEPSPLPTATATRQPNASPEPSTGRTVWLFDLSASSFVTLTDSLENRPYEVELDAATATVAIRYWIDRDRRELRFAYDGTQLADSSAGVECTESNDGAEVTGRYYQDVNCGPISPDGNWMTYRVAVSGPPDTRERGDWDQWVVDLRSGETAVLQEGLRHCGGCDGRFGPAWSPSSHYVFFPEWIQHGATFLSDVESLTTRELFSGSTEINATPKWTPNAPHILVFERDDSVYLHDLSQDSPEALPDLTAPFYFDSTGQLLYGIAKANAPRIGVYDLGDRELKAVLPGRLTYLAFYGLNLPVAKASSRPLRKARTATASRRTQATS